MRIRYLGHSAFEVVEGDITILIDPFITGNPVCTVKADELHADYVFVTHFHGDHLGDAESIAKRTGATVITMFEGAMELQAKGVKVNPLASGGRIRLPFGAVRSTFATHAFGGQGGGIASGYVITIGGKRIYHAGDTGIFGDMKLLNGVIEPGIDVAMLPAGGAYTMDPADAALATRWIAPKVVIPMHWGTFPALIKEPSEFVRLCEGIEGTRAVGLKPGEAIEV